MRKASKNAVNKAFLLGKKKADHRIRTRFTRIHQNHWENKQNTWSGVSAEMALLLHLPVGRAPFCKEYLVKPMENQHSLRARRACPCVLRCHMTYKTRFIETLQKPCANYGFCMQDAAVKKRTPPKNLPKTL